VSEYILSEDMSNSDFMAMSAELARLRAEAESFHMDYRMKCDEETKAQADEIERLREWQRQMVEIQASGGRLDGYRELAQKLADRDSEIDRLRDENAAQLAELHRISDALGTMEGPSSVDHIVRLRARLDWILDNMRQTDLMLMLPKYTGDRSGMYAAIDAAMRKEEPK